MNVINKIHPEWLKVKIPMGEGFTRVKSILQEHNLNTVCTEARCPNKSECWGSGVFTFMILGDICTRNCRFCSVTSGIPKAVDLDEPKRVAEVIKLIKSKYIVITSVDRDDLKDGGASIYAKTINLIKKENPFCKVEVLIPDFNGNLSSLSLVCQEKPDVLSHNIETVPSLYPKVRFKAEYRKSLYVLNYAKSLGLTTKSGLMLGLGESKKEVVDVLNDLREINCDFLSIGQYLQPTKMQLQVERFVDPCEFDEFKKIAYSIGFKKVESAPLVRSSYHASK